MSEKDSPEIDECQHVSYHIPKWTEDGNAIGMMFNFNLSPSMPKQSVFCRPEKLSPLFLSLG
ncbi:MULTISPECIES: hypothetical protein [Providencia]|uniref:hypothetical protein n=1 Tax=Providencia TaxID=586 RepID=UPI001E4ECC23|nr:hypothetical protein [Providencia stuartii]